MIWDLGSQRTYIMGAKEHIKGKRAKIVKGLEGAYERLVGFKRQNNFCQTILPFSASYR